MGPEVVVPVVGTLSLFVGLPLIIAGAIIARRYLKIRERELDIRLQELEVERERVTVLRLLEQNDRHEQAMLESRRR
jgi:hypothetical protein